MRACRLLFPLLASLLPAACQSGKHVQRDAIDKARAHGLVDVRAVIPGISVDLRYGTRQNVTGHPLYPPDMPCLLRASTAERLRRAQALLQAQGYGLRIWDAWRPPEAQILLHRHGGRTGMFLDPHLGWSRHCGGLSVDATLVDAQGRELRMPTYFDEDLEKAGTRYTGGDPEVKRHLDILHNAMRAAGLIPLPIEWWHFDDIDFLHHPQPILWGRKLGIPVLGEH